MLSGFRYRATRHLCQRFRCPVLNVRVCVKSLTSVRRWLDNVFISGGNPHLTSRFCKDELGPKFQHGIRACRIEGPPTNSRTKPKQCWA